MLEEIVRVLQTEPGYEETARQIDEIELRYVSSASAGERPALRRSAARMGLAATIDKQAPYAEVSDRFRRVCALGFEDPSVELAVLIEFALVCHAHGRSDEGLEVLSRAEACLTSRPGYNPASVFVRQQSELIRECRRRLEGGTR
jgi:hypothetical protein